ILAVVVFIAAQAMFKPTPPAGVDPIANQDNAPAKDSAKEELLKQMALANNREAERLREEARRLIREEDDRKQQAALAVKKIEEGKIGPAKDGVEVKRSVAKGARIAYLKFDVKSKTIQAGDDIEGGLNNSIFQNSVNARIGARDMDNKIVEILVSPMKKKASS